jgi:hypothetical protein
MKILHSTMLNTKEFNELSDKVIDSIYDLNPDIRDVYEIHVNYIADSWQIDFVPVIDNVPVIKIDTYVERDNSGGEVLKIIPGMLTDIPGRLKIGDNDAYDLCVNYVVIFEFILSLYDFEYRLN